MKNFTEWMKLREGHYNFIPSNFQQKVTEWVQEVREFIKTQTVNILSSALDNFVERLNNFKDVGFSHISTRSNNNDLTFLISCMVSIQDDLSYYELRDSKNINLAKIVKTSYEILSQLRAFRVKNNNYKKSDFLVSAIGARHGFLGNKDYENHAEGEHGTLSVDSRYSRDIRTKKRLLDALKLLTDQISQTSDGKNLIKSLHQNIYDYNTWLVALDKAEELGEDTSKIRNFVKSIFEENPPVEDRGSKSWYGPEAPDWRV